MKTTFSSSTAVLLLLAASSGAAPLTETTPIYAKPDVSSPVIGLAKAGTEPAEAPDATAPEGWTAIALPGPHELYVRNTDIGKSLDVRAGAPLHLAPKADAPVFTNMEADGKAEITGILRGDWTQIKLSRSVVGYINPGAAPAPAAPVASQPAAAAPVRSAPAVPSGEVSAAMPRAFEGLFVPAKRFLVIGPRPPYDYQLNDAKGQRIAFLELGKNKLIAAENMEKYIDHIVTVSGLLRKTADDKNLVIEAESLQLK